MTNSIQIDEVFDHVLVSITKTLADLDMVKVRPDGWKAENALVETIYTNGSFDAYILCEIEPELFEYIVSTMHGGSPPCKEEKPLYMNEYINIICGRAVSIINNVTGYASRLSVPTFHGSAEDIDNIQTKAEQKVLLYGTEKGFMRIVINYTFQ